MASRLANTPTTAVQRPTGHRAALESLSGAIDAAVPSGMSSTRFMRVCLTEISKNPKLADCTKQSFLGAVMTAAQLGLEFGPLGQAYLVPYRDTCTLIIGYKGMIDLARRSGQLQSIVARPVHQLDEFDFVYGSVEDVTHRPYMGGDRGPVVAYYGVARLADGGQVIHVMSPADVDKFRRRSATQKNEPSGPWVTDFDAMACKTVIRRMAPWLPMSVEAAQAIETDEQTINWTGTETVAAQDDQIVDADIVADIAIVGEHTIDAQTGEVIA
jgi:recombination protein RecT